MTRKPPILLFVLLMLTASVTTKAQSRDGYIQDGTSNGVAYAHKIVNCNGRNAVYLQFNNTNKYPVTVTWREKLVTRQVAKKTLSHAGQKSIVLQPGMSSPLNCGDAEHDAWMTTFDEVNATRPSDILQFEFADVAVIKTN